jgi:WD40 repeat protein
LCSCSEDKAWSIWRIDLKQADFINLGMISMSHIRSIYSISWLSKIQQNEDGVIIFKDLIATGGSDNRINIFEIDRDSLNKQSDGGS